MVLILISVSLEYILTQHNGRDSGTKVVSTIEDKEEDTMKRLIVFLCLFCLCTLFLYIVVPRFFLYSPSDHTNHTDILGENDLYFHSDKVLQGKEKATNQEYDAAISDFDDAIGDNPKDAVAYFYRGQAKFFQKRFFAAISDFNTAIRLNPDYSEAYYYRGLSNGGLNQKYAAIADYSHAILLNPKHTFAYYHRGRAYIKRNGSYVTTKEDTKNAMADFDTVIKLDPEFVNAYLSRAKLREREIRYSDGINPSVLADYNTAIRLAPDHALAYYFRGMYREWVVGEWTLEATEDIQMALKLADHAGKISFKKEIEAEVERRDQLRRLK